VRVHRITCKKNAIILAEMIANPLAYAIDRPPATVNIFECIGVENVLSRLEDDFWSDC